MTTIIYLLAALVALNLIRLCLAIRQHRKLDQAEQRQWDEWQDGKVRAEGFLEEIRGAVVRGDGNVWMSRELLECLRDNTLKLKELEGCMGSDKYGQELYEVDEVLRL